ncbi:MAG: hypothetical protein M3116_00635 [Actinomycetota bacterium]|nr:hypothetical protein [Actinomycetota bacterium]
MIGERGASRLAGASAVPGGIVWATHALLLAARPVGCVGDVCSEVGRHHRESEDLAWVLLVSVLLLTMSTGWAARRPESPGGRLRVAALLLMALGAVLLAIGLFVNASSPGGSEFWWLHDSDTLGRLVPVAATFVTGVGMLGRRDARWLAAILVVAAVIGFGFNAQDERTLLSIPIGLAWIVYGIERLAGTSTAETATAERRPGEPV